MSSFFKAVVFLILSAIVGAIGAGYWVISQISAPGPLAQETAITVEPGMGTRQIEGALLEAGALAEGPIPLFSIAARMIEPEAHLKAGEFTIPAHASPRQILDILRHGTAIQHSLTLAEGLTTLEILALVNADPTLSGPPIDPETIAEGALLPETYSFPRNYSRMRLVGRMRAARDKVLKDAWESRPEGYPLASQEEALILASIIEKETGVGDERAKVAGVFINRLRKNMLLQTDPTVIYALTLGKQTLDRELTRKDLKINSPYNTYVTPGLPPGPICNPGEAAIRAALAPQDTDALYFVADGSGGHAFARTLKEHQRNVAQWRKIQRERGLR
ncbi:MAG: endolytic transglycosylase MltG [Magnetospiraceae bacterium]